MQSLHLFRVDILQLNVIRFVCFLPGNGLFGEKKAACCPMCWRCRHRWRPLEWPGLQCRPTEWMFADWLIRYLKWGFCGSFNCMGPKGKLKTRHCCLQVFPLFHDCDCPKKHLKKKRNWCWGALANTKTLTSEQIEVTFAAHLLFGVWAWHMVGERWQGGTCCGSLVHLFSKKISMNWSLVE